ncbi:MAG: hypothetical protein AB7N70_38015 [Dehalococcoidia bacterium]|nr:hypothetical protein [Gammaproteobacteria bacterium]
MEPIVAVLILIGALIVGGQALDKEATRSGNDSAATTTLPDGEEQDRQACDTQGPRQRDLTVPYASRTTPASMDAEACDE